MALSLKTNGVQVKDMVERWCQDSIGNARIELKRATVRFSSALTALPYLQYGSADREIRPQPAVQFSARYRLNKFLGL